jgi:hypothetical protein
MATLGLLGKRGILLRVREEKAEGKIRIQPDRSSWNNSRLWQSSQTSLAVS